MRRLIAWLLVFMLPLAGMAEETLFSEGMPHASHLDYRQYFETLSAQIGECTLSIAEDAYTEDMARQLFAQVASDETALTALAPVQPHTVYVVKKPLAGMQRIGSSIYCSAAQVLDGSYRPWLTEAAFDTERWQGVGIAGIAFGDAVDEEGLCTWYAGDGNDAMLSLFPAYFVDAFATEEEMYMASKTALSMTKHILRTEGVEALFAASPEAYAQTWLASLGIDRAYSNPYAGLLDGYTYTHNQFYPLIATSPKGDVFKLKPLFDMDTPAGVRLALCDLEAAVDAILEGVKRDAPDWYPVLAKNYEGPITYEFGESQGYSITYFANRRVTIGSAASLIHETTHMMTPCQVGRISRYMDQWKVEAVAEHLTNTYYNGKLEQETIFTYLQDAYINTHESPEAQAFYWETKQIYLENASMPQTAADVRLKLWWRAAARAGGLKSVVNVYADVGSASLDAVNGNELSYTEAEWLASYLINRHGLSAFLHYCMDEGVSFEDAFGMPYADAKGDWLVNRTLLD